MPTALAHAASALTFMMGTALLVQANFCDHHCGPSSQEQIHGRSDQLVISIQNHKHHWCRFPCCLAGEELTVKDQHSKINDLQMHIVSKCQAICAASWREHQREGSVAQSRHTCLLNPKPQASSHHQQVAHDLLVAVKSEPQELHTTLSQWPVRHNASPATARKERNLT